jgi:hypothetical protein
MTQHESFSHSLVSSKLWLCEKLERIIDEQLIKNPVVNILAGWDNLLGFIMLIRRPRFYGVVNSYDINGQHINDANAICDYWNYEYPKVYNHLRDIKTLDFTNAGDESIFINCSVDQLEGTDWYDIIPANKLVCLQCTDLPISHEGWDIKQSYTIEDFMKTYQMSRFLFCESKTFDYGHLQFNRHMLIGIK